MKSYKKYIYELFCIAKEMELIHKIRVGNYYRSHYKIIGVRNIRDYTMFRHRHGFTLQSTRDYQGFIIGDLLVSGRSRWRIRLELARMMSKMFVGRWNRLRFLWRALKLRKKKIVRKSVFVVMLVFVMGCFPTVRVSRPAPEFVFTELSLLEISQKTSTFLISYDFDIQAVNENIGLIRAVNKGIGNIRDEKSGYDKETLSTHSTFIICALNTSPQSSEMIINISTISKDSTRSIMILSKVLSPDGKCTSNGKLEKLLHKVLSK